MRRQAAIVLAAILCLTGCGAGEPVAKPTAKTKTSTSQTLPKSQREALKRQAIQTARDLHEWGADSTIDVTTLNRLNAADAAGRLKGFLADTRPDSLSDLTVDESAGPDAASIPCTGDIRGGCQTVPTMRSWMSIEIWGAGARFTAGPTATLSKTPGGVRVQGTLRVMVVQDTDTFSWGDWHALTPAFKDYEIDDMLTFTNGALSAVDQRGERSWLASPWLEPWTDDMSALNASGRVAIPVKGWLDMGLTHYRPSHALQAPASQADMDGQVDWSMWNSLISDGLIDVGGSNQKQQPDNLDPEKDAATLLERTTG